ncbi:MAG: histidine--tRNA ligase [Alphaproteobacteria bacterium]|nr:histidine--tRNA ligase [Alphaproteobacteria bacterium]
MSLIQPRTPSGTLELLPRDQMVFQHMLDVIRRGYERFGFVQVETPVFELKDVLLTKSGGETEKQVYFVQSTGSLQQGHTPDMALHFDLTVPLARYVAQYERELAFPFRRYQIQRSYRGERPQKGRAREFYQCDIDVIGKDKLAAAYDAELPAIIVQIFTELGIGDFTIHFSNRKILLGLLTGWGVTDSEVQKLVLREIDKLDKIGLDKVRESIITLGLTTDLAVKLMELVAMKGDKDEMLAALRGMNSQDHIFAEGLAEMTTMVESLRALGVPETRTRINLAIARGLDYYTGTVYETLIDAHPEIGSVCSGGRYEDLASMYTKSKLPGVGLSIGATRLYEQLADLKLLPPVPHTVQVLITQLESERSAEYLALAADLRAIGLTVENYLEPAKLDKQLKYADKSGVPLAILFGTKECEAGTVLVKELARKIQHEVKREDLVHLLLELLSQRS